MAEEQQIEIDREKVQTILAQFVLPTEFENYETVFEEDSTGKLSVRLTFNVKDDVQIGRAELTRFNQFMFEVTSALLQGGIMSFPYTYLAQAA